MFFTNGCWCCCHAGGAFLFTIEKVKTKKKGYVQVENIKN